MSAKRSSTKSGKSTVKKARSEALPPISTLTRVHPSIQWVNYSSPSVPTPIQQALPRVIRWVNYSPPSQQDNNQDIYLRSDLSDSNEFNDLVVRMTLHPDFTLERINNSYPYTFKLQFPKVCVYLPFSTESNLARAYDQARDVTMVHINRLAAIALRDSIFKKAFERY
jgi:hypothetical protein